MRRAFTLIELIITMVILGIVAYVATDLIAKTYISYNRVNTLHKANLKVELALNNIANRLSYALSNTIVKRKSAKETNLAPIQRAPQDYQVLEWVGYDVDSFEANDYKGINPILSGWSGFCNIKSSTKTNIVTPGSDLSLASEIVYRLSNAKVNNLAGSAIFFPENYNYNNIGYSTTTGGVKGIEIVKNISTTISPNEFLLNDSPNPKRVTEHYKLAWSAYAVVPTKPPANKKDNPCKEVHNTVATDCTDEKPCNLCLKYNFRPWKGKDYDDTKVSASLLTTNVTVFKTFAVENRVHIKLCVKEQVAAGVNNSTSICKEKVVFK